jgi:hypothetical protein
MNIVWSVTAMNCYPQEQGNADVVFNVHWTCAGTEGDYSASVINTCQIPYAGGEFTPYEDLTQEEVLGWIWSNGVDKDATEEAVEQQIENQINPPVVTPPLPWSASNEV